MKQWNQNGIIMASYRIIRVGREDRADHEIKVDKVLFFL